MKKLLSLILTLACFNSAYCTVDVNTKNDTYPVGPDGSFKS